jgi:hypothetical protein
MLKIKAVKTTFGELEEGDMWRVWKSKGSSLEFRVYSHTEMNGWYGKETVIEVLAVDEPIRISENAPKKRVNYLRFYELQSSDVGASTIHCFGKGWQVASFLGQVLAGDVGKRVYEVPFHVGNGSFIQVESDGQFSSRKRSQGK